MNFKDERILVTGATGFVGSHLLSKLVDAGASVRVLVRRSRAASLEPLSAGMAVTTVVADLLDHGSLVGACCDIDTVFHVAGYAHAEESNSARSDETHWKVTVEGTRALLREAVRARTRRFVFASTVKAMGEGARGCLNENSPLDPQSGYGVAKRVAEQLVLEAGRRHDMHVSVVRFPLVYGRDNKGSLPRLIAAVDAGWWPPLPVIGNRRSMVHVADAVQALLLTAEQPVANGQTYIVTDGQIYSTTDIDTQIRAALGKGQPRWRVPASVMRLGARVGDAIGRVRGRTFVFNSDVLGKLTESAWYSNEKIAKELGFRPTRTLAGGLPEMVEEHLRRKNDC